MRAGTQLVVDSTGMGWTLVESNTLFNGDKADNNKMFNYSGTRKGAPGWIPSKLIVRSNKVENHLAKNGAVVNKNTPVAAVIEGNTLNDHTPQSFPWLRWPQGDDPLGQAA